MLFLSSVVQKFSRERIILAAITLLAAFFRFYRLDQLPPGFQFDQAFNAFDILRLMQGNLAIFFPANTGREPLFIYLQTAGVELFGPTSLALKLTSALIGAATIPLLYGFARHVFRSRPIAVLSALFGALSFWHIFFSRDGLRVVLEVPLTLLVFWYLWRARDKRRTSDFVFAGLFLALALYTYPSARLLPLAVIVLGAYAIWSDRLHTRSYLRGLAITFAVAIVLVLPLGIYFFLHPDQFLSHTLQVSVFSPEANANVGQALLSNAQKVLGMFLMTGDGGAIRNLPGRPVFDPASGLLFVIGFGVMLVALVQKEPERRRAVWLATWIGISLVSSLFSDDAPNFLRTLPALPALMILPAWGAVRVWERLPGPNLRRVGTLAVGAIVLVSGLATARDYFITFANLPGLYYAFDVDKVEIANWINANAETHHIFLAPLFYQQGTISLLTHTARLKSFDSRDTIVLPAATEGQDVIIGFPPEQEKKVQTLAARLGKLGTREDLLGSNGARLLWLVRIPAANLNAPDPLDMLVRGGAFVQPRRLMRAVWENEIELLGYTLTPEGAGGRNLTSTLFLRALAPITETLTFSVKARDGQGRVWGQEDKFPGDNSYPTNAWSPGEVIIEKFYPGLEACAPAGEYQLTVEVYDPETGRVLTAGQEGNAVTLGTMTVQASTGNRPEDVSPGRRVDLTVAPGFTLAGLTMDTDQVRAGESFSMSLFWRGSGQGKATGPLTIHLRDAADHDLQLATQAVVLPPEGRSLCTWFNLQVPARIAPGTAKIMANDTQIESIQIIR